MATQINSIGVSPENSTNSSIEHAVKAANACISVAEIDVQEIDYLLNVGVYRDKNIVEPSIAALIQKGIGLNLDYVKYPVENAALSMDIMNGGIGALNAMQVADALFKANRAEYIMIVSSEIHPSGWAADEFPYTSLGSAMLLEYDADSNSGFGNFTFDLDSGDDVGAEGYIDFGKHGLNCRSNVSINFTFDYHKHLLEFAEERVKRFMEDNRLDPKTTLLVSSQLNPEFALVLGQECGFADNAVIDVYDKYGDAHTSTFTLGYQIIQELHLNENAENVLFVGAGAGLNFGCSLYKL